MGSKKFKIQPNGIRTHACPYKGLPSLKRQFSKVYINLVWISLVVLLLYNLAWFELYNITYILPLFEIFRKKSMPKGCIRYSDFELWSPRQKKVSNYILETRQVWCSIRYGQILGAIFFGTFFAFRITLRCLYSLLFKKENIMRIEKSWTLISNFSLYPSGINVKLYVLKQ